MLEIFHSLDNREIALAIWLAIFLAWCSSKPDIRKALANVLSVAAGRPIVIVFGLAVVYLSAMTVALRAIDFWTLKQLKITFAWFLVAGIPALMDTPEISKKPTSLRSVIAKNFRLSLLVDFFINLFKLPLLAEIIFVPFTAFIGGLLAVAQSNDDYAPVQKLLNGIMIFIGSFFIIFETYKVVSEFDTIANLDTLRDFALPIIYNLTFVPLLWALAIYAAYESVFCRLQFIIKDDALHAFTRRALVLGFRTDIAALNVWFKTAWAGAFTSRTDVAQSIAAVRNPRNAA